MRGEKAKLAIIANSNCGIYRFPVKVIVERINTNAGVSELIAKSTELVFYQTYERYITLYCQSPEMRYANRITNHPDLFELFSLKDIASFLNVTLTCLSRICKKREITEKSFDSQLCLRVLIVRPACIQSNGCKSPARPIAGSAQPKTRVSVARPNLKEVGGKRLA